MNRNFQGDVTKLSQSFISPVAEQIDETDKRKIPQIVWAESGS